MSKNKQGASGGKHRKPGDWVAVAKGRMSREHEIVSHVNRAIPNMGDVGSAAYRRLMARGNRS